MNSLKPIEFLQSLNPAEPYRPVTRQNSQKALKPFESIKTLTSSNKYVFDQALQSDLNRPSMKPFQLNYGDLLEGHMTLGNDYY